MNELSVNKHDFEFELSRSQKNILYFIFGLVHHKQDAEDILQKTNLILLQKRDQFETGKGSFKAWAFQIARYQVLAHRTKKSRSKICFSNELTEKLAEEFTDFDGAEIKRIALNKCYKKLPEHMRKITDLRFKKELSYKEISVCVNRPISSVSATLNRARQNIMSCIKSAHNQAEQEYYNQ